MPWAEAGVKVGNNFRRILYNVSNEEETLSNLRRIYNNTDLYRSIFTYENSDLATSKISGPLFFDYDCKDYKDDNGQSLKRQVRFCIIKLWQYLRISMSEIQIYFSGHKGFHLIIPQEVLGLGYQEPNNILRHYKALAELINNEWQSCSNSEGYIDLRIYDHRRVFRLVNSINSASNLYKIPIHNLETSYEDIRNIAQVPSSKLFSSVPFNQVARNRWDILTEEVTDDRPREQPKTKKKHSTMLPCVKSALMIPVSEGKRNNVTVTLANALFQLDFSTEEIYDIMISWNKNNEPPLPDNELLRTIMSASNVNEKGWTYGCTAMRQLGLCDKSCKIRRSNQ